MAEAQLQQFLAKVRQLNALVALSEADPGLRERLRACDSHHEVVELAAGLGFDIGRRWGDAAVGHHTVGNGAIGETPGSAARAQRSGQRNLLESRCPAAGEERIDVLMELPGLRLERIHSCSCTSPDRGWYDQAEQEWVLLLRGSAQLQFADEPSPRDLAVGDSLLISPHRRHRVLRTDPAPGTLWLALLWGAEP